MTAYRSFNLMCVMSALCISTASAQSAAENSPSSNSKLVKAVKTQPSADKQKLISTASTLIKNGKQAEAYALLTPYQSEMAGNPDFDYLLGIAALDIGKPNEAIFALERTLAVRPDHLQARAEIARAFLAAGETNAAKQEFETVQRQNPPTEVSATIQKYLDIIEADRSGKQTSMQSYVEVSIGNDSNVNSATASRQIAIPFFGGATLNLNDAGVANQDTFSNIGTGFNIRHALSPSWALLGGANISKRNNANQLAFDTANGDANLGLSLNRGNDNYVGVIQLQSFMLDRLVSRNAAGMTGQWQRTLNDGSQINSYLQYSALYYPDQTFRNANRYALGSAYGTSLKIESAPVVYAGAYVGSEQPVKSGQSNLANSFLGIRAGGEMKLNPKFVLLASSSIENRMYEGTESLFQTKRNDLQSDLKLGVNYLPAKNWTLGSSLAYTDNNSNIIINKYVRTVFSLTLRRDFN